MRSPFFVGVCAAILLAISHVGSLAAETAGDSTGSAAGAAADTTGAAAVPAVNTTAAAVEGLSSTHDHGVVKLVSDPTLVGGRLMIKVVAFNRDRAPASFGPDNVKVFTAAGQPVLLVPLEKLEAEAHASNSSRGDRSVDVFGAGGSPVTGRDAAGRPDVGNYTGGSSSMGVTFSSREHRPVDSGADDAKVQQQIADLRAAILQPLTVPPASAVGGEVVTQSIKFGRKEARALRVVVDFNGEQHEFNFTAPPAR
jgi:hypothetical protein